LRFPLVFEQQLVELALTCPTPQAKEIGEEEIVKRSYRHPQNPTSSSWVHRCVRGLAAVVFRIVDFAVVVVVMVTRAWYNVVIAVIASHVSVTRTTRRTIVLVVILAAVLVVIIAAVLAAILAV
jgi:hypothetical protein